MATTLGATKGSFWPPTATALGATKTKGSSWPPIPRMPCGNLLILVSTLAKSASSFSVALAILSSMVSALLPITSSMAPVQQSN